LVGGAGSSSLSFLQEANTRAEKSRSNNAYFPDKRLFFIKGVITFKKATPFYCNRYKVNVKIRRGNQLSIAITP
jgi:hypothetical protein